MGVTEAKSRPQARDLEMVDVWASYGKKEVLRGLSLSVGSGETVALLGDNGAGKSTTLKVIAGVLRPHRGTIRFGQSFLAGRLPHEACLLGVGYLLQGGRVFPSLTVRENLEVAASSNRDQRGADGYGELLFGRLAELWNRRAGLLSGGERQMLAIQMVLRLRPGLLLLDEPSAGLAPPMVNETLGAIAAWAKTAVCPVLLVEQNVGAAVQVADRCLVLEEGRIRTLAAFDDPPAATPPDGKARAPAPADERETL